LDGLDKICGVLISMKKSVVTKYTKFSEHKFYHLWTVIFIM